MKYTSRTGAGTLGQGTEPVEGADVNDQKPRPVPGIVSADALPRIHDEFEIALDCDDVRYLLPNTYGGKDAGAVPACPSSPGGGADRTTVTYRRPLYCAAIWLENVDVVVICYTRVTWPVAPCDESFIGCGNLDGDGPMWPWFPPWGLYESWVGEQPGTKAKASQSPTL